MSSSQGLQTQVTTLINKSYQRGTTKRGPVYDNEGAVGRWAPHVPMTSQSTVRTQEIPTSVPWQLNADTYDSADVRRYVPKWLMIDDYGNSLVGSLAGLTRGVLRRHVDVTMSVQSGAQKTDTDQGTTFTAYQMPRLKQNVDSPFDTSFSHHNALSCPNRILAVRFTTTEPIVQGATSVGVAEDSDSIDTTVHTWYVRTEGDDVGGQQLRAVASKQAKAPKYKVASVSSGRVVWTDSFVAEDGLGSPTDGSIPTGTTLIVFRRRSKIVHVDIRSGNIAFTSTEDAHWALANVEHGNVMNLTENSADDSWMTGKWPADVPIVRAHSPLRISRSDDWGTLVFTALSDYNGSTWTNNYNGNVEIFENAQGGSPTTDRVFHDIGRNSLRQFGIRVKYFNKNVGAELIRGPEAGQWEWFYEGGSLTFFDPAGIPGVPDRGQYGERKLTNWFPPVVDFIKYVGKFASDGGLFNADVQIGSGSLASLGTGQYSQVLQFGEEGLGAWRIALVGEDNDTALVFQKFDGSSWISKSVLTK